MTTYERWLSVHGLTFALGLFLFYFGVFAVFRQGWFVPFCSIVTAVVTASRGDMVITIIVAIVNGGLVVSCGGVGEQRVVEGGHRHSTHHIVVVIVG